MANEQMIAGPGFDWTRDLPALLGSIGGLRGGSNAFARRWQQLEAMKAQRDAQAAQEARLAQAQQSQADLAQQRLMLEADAAARQRDEQQINYMQSTRDWLSRPDVLDPDVALRMVTLGAPAGIERGALEQMVRELVTPTKRERAEASQVVDEIEKDPYVRKLREGGQDLSEQYFEKRGKRLTLREWQQIAGRTLPTGTLPALPTAPSRPRSDFDDFWDNDYLPAVVEQRKAAGNTAPLTRTDIRDLKLHARERWNAAGRAPEDTTPSPSEQRTVLRDRQTELRAALRDALEFPDQQKPGTLKRLASEFGKHRLDFDREIRALAAEIARDRAADAQRSLNLEGAGLDVPGADALIANFERTLREAESPTPPAAPTGGRGRGIGPGPVGGTTPPTRTASRADVQAVATRTGTTYAEAKRQLEARGVVVTE